MLLTLFRCSLGSLLLTLTWGNHLFAQAETPAPAQGPVPPRQVSGIYPHLAYWNSHQECGTGAVVPWAGKLWVITYAPHFPLGSSDKLYAISSDLQTEVFEGSVGGTPANRMLHRETNQLLIGPYVIDHIGNVRVIPPTRMPGRLTGNARHLFQPAEKVYYATMEEGLYEVDLKSLDVKELFRDNQRQIRNEGANEPQSSLADLPGYHGKGLYSGQGRLIYANNGESSSAAMRLPDTPSGCLAEWDGVAANWKVIRRNQFTDVRGPGGMYGNDDTLRDPVWAIGWDHKSLLLMLLDQGNWHCYRLPKASHAYDGAHGWNTEWPRFQDIGQAELLMTMHGMFWKFPKTFCLSNSAGILPRSTYLKVIGDFTRWNDRLVFGCDDTAASEFLNKRRAKGNLEGPGQSHSNLWFTSLTTPDQLGPPLGRGAVWSKEAVVAGAPSDPFLFQGFDRRGLQLTHQGSEPVLVSIEVDRQGHNQWTPLRQIAVDPMSSQWVGFEPQEAGVWLRLVVDRDVAGMTAQFHYSNADKRTTQADAMFDSLARLTSENRSGGLLRVRGEQLKKLAFVGQSVAQGVTSEPRFYELDEQLRLTLVNDPTAMKWMQEKVAFPTGIVERDQASAIIVDDDGRRWRLPLGDRTSAAAAAGTLGPQRVCREVVTERDLLNCAGIFYELPARNAGDFAKLRPICTHNRAIHDYCSYRGLLVLSGVEANAKAGEHVVRSDDGQVALWVGVVDDLWKFGKPVGYGGPWNDTAVAANVPSDPYLMTGFDHKSVAITHRSSTAVRIRLQLDVDGTGNWVDAREMDVPAGNTVEWKIPDNLSAYWIRAIADRDTQASVMLTYE